MAVVSLLTVRAFAVGGSPRKHVRMGPICLEKLSLSTSCRPLVEAETLTAWLSLCWKEPSWHPAMGRNLLLSSWNLVWSPIAPQ